MAENGEKKSFHRHIIAMSTDETDDIFFFFCLERYNII